MARKIWPHKAFGKKTGKWAARKKRGKGFKMFNTKTQAQAYAGTKKSSSKSSKSTAQKSSTKRSSPSGGANTSKTPKLGLLLRRVRTALNLLAPGWGAVAQPGTQDLGTKVSRACERYSGYNPQRGTLNWTAPKEAYQGIAVSLVNDWADRKLRNSTKISKGKIFNILAELMPALRARFEVPAGSLHPLYEGACNYNKRTDGYDPQIGSFVLDRVEEYATGKALVAIYDKAVPSDWKAAANRALPDGFNPF